MAKILTEQEISKVIKRHAGPPAPVWADIVNLVFTINCYEAALADLLRETISNIGGAPDGRELLYLKEQVSKKVQEAEPTARHRLLFDELKDWLVTVENDDGVLDTFIVPQCTHDELIELLQYNEEYQELWETDELAWHEEEYTPREGDNYRTREPTRNNV